MLIIKQDLILDYNNQIAITQQALRIITQIGKQRTLKSRKNKMRISTILEMMKMIIDLMISYSILMFRIDLSQIYCLCDYIYNY